MIKACIFDLDGTLADTVESIALAINKGLEYFGYKPRPAEEYKYYAGDGLRIAFQRALNRAGDTQGRCLDDGLPLIRQWFHQEPLYHVHPYPGITEMLAKLKERQMPLAVLTNKPHPQAIRVVEGLFGKNYFDIIQGQTDALPRKPDPTGACQIAQKLGVPPELCLYVGDTNTDMLTGNRAGMYTVGVTWGFREEKELKESGAQKIIYKPDELLLLLSGAADGLCKQ